MTAPNVVTTPVVPAAPVAAPVAAPIAETAAPVVEQTPTQAAPPSNEPQGMQSVIDRITRSVTPDALAAPLGDTPDAKATPTDPAALADPSLAAPTPDAPPTMVAAITADEPDGEVVMRARDPNTGQWSEMDQTRTYELSIKDKASGETKVYNKTLPELMRMAKDGIAMQKSRDELQYYREAVPQWQEAHTTQQSELDGLRALAIELLSADEATVIARRDAYAAENTPDKVLARREAELRQREQRLQQDEQRRQQAAQQQMVAAYQADARQKIGPAITEVERLVGQELAAGKMLRDTAHLMVGNVIPPERFPQLEAYVKGPYLEWAKQEAQRRAQTSAAAQAQRDAATRELQRAQQAVRDVGSATRPLQVLSGGAPAQVKPPARGVQDVINNIVRGNGRPAPMAG